jgi:hypothetical protein
VIVTSAVASGVELAVTPPSDREALDEGVCSVENENIAVADLRIDTDIAGVSEGW